VKIKIEDNTKLWFTSDQHFGHENSLNLFRQNEFENIDVMDQTIINNWNKVVQKGDTVICLGDFAFRNTKTLEHYRNSLNGSIIMLRGNHDSFQDGQVKGLFPVYDYLELKVKDDESENGSQKVICMHYPILSYNGMYKSSIHCYGHVHRNTPINAPIRSVNCCVELWNYTPISYKQIKEKIGLNPELNKC
jgi:calcineurin-like phosphoesterase family protein